ncbi:MAG: DUF3021 family protein [Sporolactobacillus sp.]
MKTYPLFLKLVNYLLIGCGCGGLSTTIYLLIARHFAVQSLPLTLIFKQLVGSMAFGCYCGVVALLFQIFQKRLRSSNILAVITTVHFVLLIAGFLYAGNALAWFTLSAQTLILPLLSFIIIYALIWVFSYLYARHMVRLLNDGLKHL